MGKFGERILATHRVAGRHPAHRAARARRARPLGGALRARPSSGLAGRPRAAQMAEPNRGVA